MRGVKDASTHAIRAHSLASRLRWLLPPAAALFYPLAVRALYASGKLLHQASGSGTAVAWIAIAVSVALVYSVPAAGIGVAYVLEWQERISSSELLARRFAHLAVASPPFFVLIGVVFYLVHSANGDYVFSVILWLIVLAATAWAVVRPGTEAPASSTSNPIPLRMAHGSSALLIVLIFLAWHLLNHASAALSPEFNQAMMATLRKWYRSEFVQPVLVTLVLFQVVSGLILFRRATAGRSDLYRTLQTSTGAFLSVFIVSHLMQSSFWVARSPRSTRPSYGRPALQWVSFLTRGTCGSFRITRSAFGSSSPTSDLVFVACCSLTGCRRAQPTVSHGLWAHSERRSR